MKNQRDFEVHGTFFESDEVQCPTGFWSSEIRNMSGVEQEVQHYWLHTCRFADESDVPWSLAPAYRRFKVEGKLLEYRRESQLLNFRPLSQQEGREIMGLELHVSPGQRSSVLDLSYVDQDSHGTTFIPMSTLCDIGELVAIVAPFLRDSEKLYLEAVLFDSVPELDDAWRLSSTRA